jgi:hypothetical protein
MQSEFSSLFVGGEFYDDPDWQLDRPALSTGNAHFLNGGRACLAVIAGYLRGHGINRILLPAYLCPTILDVFQRLGLDWAFYRVHQDLSIDLADLEVKKRDFPAVYFINYFGFPNAAQTLSLLRDFQMSGKLLVEDNAQAGFPNHMIGDFAFNSLRKLAPFDGGYLFTELDINPYLHRNDHTPNRRLPLMRAYRRELREYLLTEQGSYHRLSALHARAERYYEQDMVITGDPLEQERIERQDWQGMRRKRRVNYQYLLERLPDIPEIKPLFPVLDEDASPLGLPVYVESVSRDSLYEYLGEHSIGLFIHWQEILGDERFKALPEACSMAGRMLTLCCDQRTSLQQLDYLLDCLREGIAFVKR